MIIKQGRKNEERPRSRVLRAGTRAPQLLTMGCYPLACHFPKNIIRVACPTLNAHAALSSFLILLLFLRVTTTNTSSFFK